jgi:twinkle protein
MIKDAPLFYTSKTVKPKDRSKIVSIKTGLADLDKKIMGLNKGEVSVVSGLRGSAKSTWVSQIALEAVQNNRTVALFSGELSEHRVLEWLQLQAAGKQYAQPTTYEYWYTVPDDIKGFINQWLEQRLFIYNNDYGKKVDNILRALEDCITRKKVDIVVLDNLMSIDLDASSHNKNEKQSSFSQTVDEFAEKYDVHIILVAHPRKAQGFLRIDDISGTGDITNAADNVFIIHRVNNDFKRLSKAMFYWDTDHEIYQFDNVLEICKNRDFGYQDEMIGMYFEKESKRLSCYRDNPKMYNWTDYFEVETESSPFSL